MQKWDMFCCRHEMQILKCYSTIKKGCIKNIKYVMLKNYKQEHLSSSNIASTTTNSIQNMIECNSTISSNSRSNEATTIVSSSPCADLSAITYQYHQFNHFDNPPNQTHFSQYVPSFSWWCMWDSMVHNEPHWLLLPMSAHWKQHKFFQNL